MVEDFGKIFVEIRRKTLKKLLQDKDLCDIITVLFLMLAIGRKEKETEKCPSS